MHGGGNPQECTLKVCWSLFPSVASGSESADVWGSSMITQPVSDCEDLVQEVTHMFPGKASLKIDSWLSSKFCKHLGTAVSSRLHWGISVFLVGGLVLRVI